MGEGASNAPFPPEKGLFIMQAACLTSPLPQTTRQDRIGVFTQE
ncbi:hypothetical protein Z949_2684 [Sulfitobacter guttiformis KCTC 32187]|nr:hypothetical protein Z949_2684 [Sulfitobacter guttiformis KCTC 32187]